MKLQQGQTWKLNEHYVRITLLERLAVEYKLITDLVTKSGTRNRVTKKEFCRLVKDATLLTGEEIAAARDTQSETLSQADIEGS